MAKERFELSDGVKDLLNGMGKLSAEMKDNSAKAMEYAQSMDKLAKQNTELTKLNEALSTSFSKVSNALNKASSGNDLTKYIQSQENMVKSINRTYKQYSIQTDVIKKNRLAEELYKQVNALRAITDNVDLSNLVGNFEEVKKVISSVSSHIKSEFSVSAFKEINETIETLERAGLNIKNVFLALEKGSQFNEINRELRETKNQLELINNADISELTGKLKKLSEIAEEEFDAFLNLYNLSGNSYKFYDIFEEIRSGAITSQQAIEQVKNEFDYLLAEAKLSGNQNFDILNSSAIREMVENISTLHIKVDEIMTKISDTSGMKTNMEIFNEEQFNRLLILFEKIESSLSSMKSVFVDVGDGEEFSPLLKMIDNVQSSVNKLSTSVKGIGLNMSIDVGSNKEIETKFQEKTSKALIAYQRLFEHIKSTTTSQLIFDKFNDFNLDNFDTTYGKAKAIADFIERARNDSKLLYNGHDVLKEDTAAKYWNQASAAMGQATKVLNEMKASSDTNPLENLFGKTDLTEVITQLNLIVDKLGEISSTASEFKNTFANGFNVSASVEEIEKLTSRVKELEDELSKVNISSASPVKTNISSGNNIVSVQDKITDQIVENEERKQKAYKATADAVMYHAGVVSKLNKAETNGRFYGSNRGTGYFGTGHYFVDSATKHELDNNSSYSKLPYTSIDISQYDNLFKATTNELASGLHNFLENLTRFTQGSDSNTVSELFSQFQKVFGETVMDMQEFDATLEKLKVFMQNSSMEDRSDSVSTQFMKSLGYGGVDTRGTRYADTRYGTVIYDLKEESILQANITDELQKQGQMLEKINYEKGQVFDQKEDTRIQGILDQQARAKEINAEFDSLFDSTKIRQFESDLQSVNDTLKRNDEIIADCQKGINNADAEARKFARDMEDLGLGGISDEEIAEQANNYRVTFQERIDKLEKERPLLEARRKELEENLSAEYKLANAAMERAKAIVEERYTPIEDTFQGGHSDNSEASGVKQYKKKGYKAHDTGNHDNERKVANKKELSRVLKELQTEIIASIDESTQFVKEVTDFYDSQDNLVKTQMKIGDKNGSMSTYTTSYSTDKEGNSTAWTSHITTEKVAEATKQASKEIQAEWEKNVKAIQEYMDANTKLNNLKAKDKGTGKHASEIAYQTKEVERLEKVAIEARTALSSMINPHEAPIDDWNKWLEAMKQFDQATEGSARSVARLEDALRNMAKSQSDKIGSIVDSNQAHLDKLKPTEGNRSANFEKAVQGYKEAISALREFHNTLDGTTPLTKKQYEEYEKLTLSLKDARVEMEKFSAAEKGSTEGSRWKEIDKITKYLEKNTRISKIAKQQLEAFIDTLKNVSGVNVEDIHMQFNKIAEAERRAGREGKRFFDILSDKALYGKAAQLAGYYLSFTDFIRYGKQMVDTVIEIDTALTELRKVSDATEQRLTENFKNSAKTAKDLGATVSDVISATADWARMGYNVDDAEELARISTLYKNVGDGIEIEEANNSLISTLQGFQMDAEEAESIVDKFNEVKLCLRIGKPICFVL